MLFFFLYEVSSFGLTGPLLVTLLLPLYPKARLAVLTLSLPADLQRFLIVLLVVQGLFNYADYDVNTNVLIFICSELCPFGVLHLHWDSVLCRAPWHETGRTAVSPVMGTKKGGRTQRLEKRPWAKGMGMKLCVQTARLEKTFKI